ncbi:glycogen biosynthesis protein GlgD [Bacillus sp. SM2101]|uniref:glycogen biosynthesis protein GlgD n=1 Tax=Bacillus sp. SM2101 TaxID=2805366 RepID=UPI001BDF5F7E|nr:glycogen biosynthesis protein GlgD [Bacillus sp. SM2101]
MKKRSKQNNPEQKTKNGINNNDIELGREFDPKKIAKQNYAEKGQPVTSKQHKNK